jgi:hypothetical protein
MQIARRRSIADMLADPCQQSDCCRRTPGLREIPCHLTLLPCSLRNAGRSGGREFDLLAGPPPCVTSWRRIRDILIAAGARFRTDNIYTLELKNGSRVLAPPGGDDSIRGLTVDGWIVADEAAQLSNDLIAALSPMRARRPQARFCDAVDGLEPH